MKSYYKFLIPLFVIISCTQKNNELKKSAEEIKSEKGGQMDSLNISKAISLSSKNNAIIGWNVSEVERKKLAFSLQELFDSTQKGKKKYTYALQELFDTTNKPVSFLGRVVDIIKKDSLYILHLHNSDIPSDDNYLSEISVSFLKFQKLKKFFSNGRRLDGCFIFKVNKVISAYPKLTSDIEYSGSDDPSNDYSYLTYDFDENLIVFKGELVDFYIFKSLDNNY